MTAEDAARTAEWHPNVTCVGGLLPFYAWYFVTGSAIALAVVLNGVLFHFFFPQSTIVKIFDVACNVSLALFVNLAAMNLAVSLLTLFGAGAFFVNTVYVEDDIKNRVHVVSVQFPLFCALCVSGL